MDRPIDPQEIRSRAVRRGLITAAVAVAVILLGVAVRSWVRPSLRASKIRTAVVDRGLVEAAILCSGTVVPAMEQVIPCPFSSRVLTVFEQPGARVEAGQPLLELDDSEVSLAVERLEDQIALMRNRRRELRLRLESTLGELKGKIEIQRERLAFLETKTEQQRSLRDLGLTTIHELKQAEVDEKIASIELRQLAESMAKARETTQAQIEGLEIETSLLERNLRDQQEQLARATVRADRDGVLTWITTEEGATVLDGAEVARVADLSRFRVEATASDLHINRMTVGMPVRVVADDTTLSGRVASIPPAIDKGIMTLKVELDQPDHPSLRANRRVDVHVITATREDTLRIAKGPFTNGTGEQDVFVVRGGEASRIRATIGVAGIDHYELLSGPAEGDTIIISSMADYLHLERLRVR